MVRRIRAADLVQRHRAETGTLSSAAADLLAWTEAHRRFADAPMRVPAPLCDLYRDDSPYVVVMKGAQMGLSEWAINVALHTADTNRAGRGNSLYLQPGGENVGDFVQARVNPAIEQSSWLISRVRISGSTRDPDKIGLRRIGNGYTYWRTAGSRSGLKSIPIDTLILDEYDEMPEGTLALARHRLDSSTAPLVRILSTPTYPGAGIEPEYRAGDQRQYFLPCSGCAAWQYLEWERNVVDGERVCADCGGSLEATVAEAWEHEGVGEWRPTNPEGTHHSYQLSQLYRPNADLRVIAAALASSNETTAREARNQHLGLPYSPSGGQLSLEELRRISIAPFTFAEVAGIQGRWMGVDVGKKLHVWIEHYSERWNGNGQRYLVAALEVDDFRELDELMQRFRVETCVIDAHPDLHAARDFQARWPGQVYLADYVHGRLPVRVSHSGDPDPQRRYRVQVDRTGIMDAVAAGFRTGRVLFPSDAASIPGLFAQLQAPVRQLRPDANGNPRAVYDEGTRPDHFYHAAVYAELALTIDVNRVEHRTLSADEMIDLLGGAPWRRILY